ncbi:glycosyltransferase [Flavobacterium sp. AG291]|uniref:glycosyltransferase n=1 Tax=Flavobacterium sp. AG291 TaxID=2184000 RepID=UPI000E0B8FED|nr:glycosyltransferase [Flavobacterium sp. AG291]RDI12180.1 glycosyltransferase involved in cell wall biosynthesis [Flavobacterium sp. AG291]
MNVKILQISSELNVGSVGRVSEQIGDLILAEGWESYIAYGREAKESKSVAYKIGTHKDLLMHGVYTRLTDKHGFGSKQATKKLVQYIDDVNPDIIHLHHLHGYYINIEVLFSYLQNKNIPVVWTFHDCWSFTGHCAHYDFIGCDKWKKHCSKCPQLSEYPQSFVDNSYDNYDKKKELFRSVANMSIVAVSNWIKDQVKESFLSDIPCYVVQNGVDVNVYKPVDTGDFRRKYNLENKKIILGVASPWSEKKGLQVFCNISEQLGDDEQIVLVGLSAKQIKNLPDKILGIERTTNLHELVALYSTADVFVNPTYEDSFPTTNLESMACGTPVITFNTGGSVESVTEETGIVVEKGNESALMGAISEVVKNGKQHYSESCIERVSTYFNKNNCFDKYIKLYKNILSSN